VQIYHVTLAADTSECGSTAAAFAPQFPSHFRELRERLHAGQIEVKVKLSYHELVKPTAIRPYLVP
jgi:hypothetical protein